MDYNDTNTQRGTFMLLALIILLVVSFATPEAHAYRMPDYQLDREQRELVASYTGFTDNRAGRALSERFDTVSSTPKSTRKRDKTSGDTETEDDDC